MAKIKCTQDVMASGKPLEKDKQYECPKDLSEQDASTLVKTKRAEWVKGEEPKGNGKKK